MITALLEAIRGWLVGQGITDPVFLQHRPPKAPDRCIVLRDYGDAQAPPFVLDGRLQVLCRGPRGDVKVAKELAEAVHVLLWPAASEAPALELTAGSREWLFGIEHLSGPLDLGADEGGRFEFSTNYRLYGIRQ